MIRLPASLTYPSRVRSTLSGSRRQECDRMSRAQYEYQFVIFLSYSRFGDD